MMDHLPKPEIGAKSDHEESPGQFPNNQNNPDNAQLLQVIEHIHDDSRRALFGSTHTQHDTDWIKIY